MGEDKTYNGFPNYETWSVSLWIGNDAASYEHFRELTREVVEAKTSQSSALLTKRQATAIALADALREEFEESSPAVNEASVYADLLNAALSEVDWYGLANDLLDEYEQEKST